MQTENEEELHELEIQPAKFQSFLAGCKLHTIRNGHRRYSKSLRVSSGSASAGGICNSYVHTIPSEIPFFILEGEGFRNFKEVMDTLRIFYPDITNESPVTIVEFRLAI